MKTYRLFDFEKNVVCVLLYVFYVCIMYLQLMLSSFYNDAKQIADYGRGFVMMDITVRSDFLKEKGHPAMAFSLKVL